jgi:hypothetical protein
LTCRRDQRGVDGGDAFLGGQLEGSAGQVVDGAEVAAGDLVDRIRGLRVEGGLSGASDAQAMLHLVGGFRTAEEPEHDKVSHAPADRLQFGAVEQRAGLGVPGQDETRDLGRCHESNSLNNYGVFGGDRMAETTQAPLALNPRLFWD